MMPLPSTVEDEGFEEKKTIISEDFMSCPTSVKNLVSITELQQQPTDSTFFGDKDCGEPHLTQHLIFDFKCDDKRDSEESINKCYEFWDFIQNEPQFQNLMVIPETSGELQHTTGSSMRKSSYKTKSSVKESEHDSEQPPRTAVSMLSFVEGQGLIDHLFETKLPITYCPVNVPEYLDHHFGGLDEEPQDNSKACHCVVPCKCKNKRRDVAKYRVVERAPRAPDLNEEINKWDKEHPKQDVLASVLHFFDEDTKFRNKLLLS